VSRLVRRLRRDRHANAREVIAELDEIALGLAVGERDPTLVEPPHAKPVELEARTDKIRRKRHVAPWLLAVVVIGTAVAGSWWLYGQRTVAPTARVAVAPTPPQPLAAAPPPVVAVAPPVVSAETAPAPEIVMPATPVARDTRRRKEHVKRERKVPAVVSVTDEIPVPAPVPVPAPAPAPILEPPVAKPLPPTIATVVGTIAVRGSLSEATVHRAIDRITPAIRQCAPTNAQSIQVHFSIGESRRATNVVASGAASTSGCVTAAFASMRSEAAPDVGDADVDVQIAYVIR